MINIKNNIENLLIECVLNEDKNTSKIIIDGLKNDKDISALYVIVDNLKYPKNINESYLEEYINENINFFKKTVNVKRLTEMSKKINKNGDNVLDEAINYILSNDKLPFNFSTYIENFNVVLENIKKSQEKTFNKEEYDFICENFKDPEKKQLEVSQEILNFLNEQLKNELDPETQIMIYETKESIYNKLLSGNNLNENLIDLLILKNKLLV